MQSGIDARRDDGAVSLADRLSRYDLLLLAIPLTFASAWLASVLVGVPTRSALTAAAVVGAATVADGLFRRPPRPTVDDRRP
jgi:hypothetical protein